MKPSAEVSISRRGMKKAKTSVSASAAPAAMRGCRTPDETTTAQARRMRDQSIGGRWSVRRSTERPITDDRTPRLRGDGRRLPEHLAEHLDGGLHLRHRAERDPAVGLLEGREVARHDDVLLAAGVAELAGGPADVDEHEVRL